MKKTRVFKPVRVERKPSSRWLARPSVEREKWWRFAEDSFARVKALHERPYPEGAEPNAFNAFGQPVNERTDTKEA
ncbi:hypothetical protein [Burkholderia cepacia]|uniref:Uncharacterized protein n=1 Tax=Burkholderia cepacia TaxID=292 RepID=A0ABN5CY33_BURCE|nr:hypothetical protein [Burkholderia cepacia]AIO25086.1 hypothetical protein DM41_2958 [Burkholderia cepacia ATCC 25416]ALK18500.1 hypothetical protein APZ15_12165 [Burkholderia cepacia ATCC 25416]ASE96025.1 hypothetical protein CEQ23_22115 [Burkholderia cepacia]ATF78972.1 hypothetical protein CO711_17145 [Burkholderia cepacia]MCA8466891.1 hypothetical protein [Burkholderia cepacia]